MSCGRTTVDGLSKSFKKFLPKLICNLGGKCRANSRFLSTLYHTQTNWIRLPKFAGSLAYSAISGDLITFGQSVGRQLQNRAIGNLILLFLACAGPWQILSVPSVLTRRQITLRILSDSRLGCARIKSSGGGAASHSCALTFYWMVFRVSAGVTDQTNSVYGVTQRISRNRHPTV